MDIRKRLGFINNYGIFKQITVIVKFLLMITCCLAMLSLMGCKENFVGILNPKGLVAFHERKLLFDTLALMLIVVLPVIIMSLTFVYYYRVSHHVSDYKPNWGHSFFLESIWWGIPCVIIVVLAILTWKKTYELDPFRQISGSSQPPLLIQAIALPWKWLFIYPEQNIATINYLQIPIGRQVEFWMTTDNVPMSALFIPQLGSQIYAMAGMRTRLHLIPNAIGTFDGLNTQYNGDGFSDMHFAVHVVEVEQMLPWINEIKTLSPPLTDDSYRELLVPSMGDKPKFFSGVTLNLFENVLLIYQKTFGNIHPRAKLATYP